MALEKRAERRRDHLSAPFGAKCRDAGNARSCATMPPLQRADGIEGAHREGGSLPARPSRFSPCLMCPELYRPFAYFFSAASTLTDGRPFTSRPARC